MNALIKSATIIDKTSPFHLKKCDLLIENDVIAKIAENITNSNNYDEIEFDNLHVSQGWFDTGVCLGEPGFEERENITNGLLTAARSGFTAVAVNPNTFPVCDNKSAIEFLKTKAKNNAVSLYPIGNLTQGAKSKDIAELYDMQNSGAIAFGDYNQPLSNANLLKIGLQYAQNFDGLIVSFPQDNAIAGTGQANEEINSTKIGLKGIPALAEELQITRDLFILEYTGGKLHIPTISTAKSVELIKKAKESGLQVTCSVAAHHLVLTDDELLSFNCNAKVLPPLRTKKDNEALINGILDATIDSITSDHNPIDIEHKKLEFNNAKFGTIGMESLFGALNKPIGLEPLISCLTSKPKDMFGIKMHSINEGNIAELTLFNPDFEYTFSEDSILSTSKNSVFLNKKLNGKVYGIISNSKKVL